MLKRIMLLCTALLLAGSLYADADSHKKAAIELLKAAQTDKMVDDMIEQMKQMMSSMPTQPGITEKQKATMDSYQKKVMDLVSGELSWGKMENEFADAYAKAYTEDELKGLTEFYRSPLGQKLLEKSPKLMEESMMIPQKHIQAIAPQVQEIMMKMAQEMSAGQPQPAAPAK